MHKINLLLTALIVCTMTSCDQSTKDTSGAQLKNILNVLDVNICNIKLSTPSMVSVITEFDNESNEVFTPGLFEDQFIVAVQPDKDTGRIRIAIGNTDQALSSNLIDSPYAKRAWIFHHSPIMDSQGRYTIMETPPGELPSAKIVALTKKP